MISIRNITKTYGTGDAAATVLHGVSFDIEQGDFVAIMGPSGSGKSTIMNILGLLDVPTNGSYLFEGTDVATLTDDAQAAIRAEKIGFVFQSFNLLPRATVLRNVQLPLLYHQSSYINQSERVVRASEALKHVGFPEDRMDHLSNQLSGGQIQRVAIARALVNNPALILADEPTGNLDTATSHLVLETFQRLNREDGRTIVLITHEPDIAAYAHRTIVVRDGRIVSSP